MKLKICGMLNSENLRKLNEKIDPDFIGFIFYEKSPRYFLKGAKDIPLEIPAKKRVGVFVNAGYDEICRQAEKFHLTNIQLHGNESPEFCNHLFGKGFAVIKAFGISNPEDLQKTGTYAGSCHYFLFDTKTGNYGGSGQKFDWNMLNQHKKDEPYFLSGGISAEDVQNILNLKNIPHSIDINSRFETAPGIKDINKILLFKTKLFNHA
jgi:phosphoribosylanthranilate isomerase